jgi:SAM-dependent methyltransferase
MKRSAQRAPAPDLRTYADKVRAIAGHIRSQAERHGPLEILEAGCGTRWDINLRGVQYRLTGIDSDQAALDQRLNRQHDIDKAILGDLRKVDLPDCTFDVVFCSDVLEHVAGAESVLDNFVRWLKPGGIMILGFPNRDSSYAFLTRITPLWAHIAFKKYLQGYAAAGRPGAGPFPTVFDRVVSRTGMRAFVAGHELAMRAEYRRDQPLVRNRWLWGVVYGGLWLLHVASAGRLTVDHRALLYVIEKPE